MRFLSFILAMVPALRMLTFPHRNASETRSCLRHLVKDEVLGWLEAGCSNLSFFSVPSLLFKPPLCFHVVDTLWCKFV